MGVQSGFYDLDLALRENEFKSRSYLRIDKGGLIGGKVYVLAGRPGMGKTTLLLNILENTSVRGTRLAHCPAVLFSLEMSKRQIIDRLISIDSGIDIKKINGMYFNSQEWEAFEKEISILKSSKLIIDDRLEFDVDEIYEKSIKYYKENHIALIAIDYLQVVDHREMKDIYEKMAYIMKRLKVLAEKLSIPIIITSHISKLAEYHKNCRPQLSDFKPEDIVKYADVVMCLYMEDYYKLDSDKKGIAEVMVFPDNGCSRTVELGYTKCGYVNLEKDKYTEDKS